MRLCALVSISLVLLVLFLFGIFLLLPFPLAVFPAIVKSQVYIQHRKDGSFPKATAYWSNLPAIQYYDFYFFNVTNPDEVLNYGAKAHVVEVGPYSYAETEFKEDIEFLEGDTRIFYQNNKTWVYNPATSCDSCSYDDVVTLSNPSYMTILYAQKNLRLNPVITTALDIFLILAGETPISTVPMAGVLFEGYPDPLITIANKINDYFDLGLPVPKAMGYFPGYNHTNDGDYESKTGKDNVNNLGLIQKWCNDSQLHWWGDEYSRDISNSGDGAFQKPGLKKTDTLKQFQSFMCRSFYLHYDSDSEVRGIKTLRFKMDDDTYDSTIQKNRGYRYENRELIDYFPSWPCGFNHSFDPNWPGCGEIDCTISINFCDKCCNGSHYEGPNGENATVFLPQGINPMRCLPGKPVDLPFAGFISPPHFAWSPPEVYNSIYGLNPDPNGRHHPGTFDISPVTGSSVGAAFRMQFAVPIYTDNQFVMLSNCGNVFLPTFWVDLRVTMKEYAYDYLYFNTVTLPRIVLGIGIGLVALSCIGTIGLLFCLIRTRRRVSSLPKDEEIWSE